MVNKEKYFNIEKELFEIGADIDFDEKIHDVLIDAQNTALLFAKMKKKNELKLISCY